MQHEIYLNRYAAQLEDSASFVKLGTAGSFGSEELLLYPGEDWEGLAITATFHPPGGGEAVRMLASAGGIVSVPPEATATAGLGKIVFAGLMNGARRLSCDLMYRVEENEGAEGGGEAEATPSVIEQAVTAAASSALAAENAALEAGAFAQRAEESAAGAAASETAAQASAQAAAESETAAAESEAEAQAAAAAAAASETTAKDCAGTARTAAEAAERAAEEAAENAETAATGAQTAQSAATAAADSAKAAAFSAQAAATSALTAQNAAQAAGSSETRAAAAASAAETSAQAAASSETAAAESETAARAAAESAEAAAVHPPRLSESNTWMIWNLKEAAYRDTGLSAVGPKGDTGTGINLSGSYESYEALAAAHPVGSEGDAYTVKGDLWVWTDGAWANAGQLQGAKGDPGPRGEPGEDGADGQDGYTPVKGVDYLTEAEVSDFKEEVLAETPDAVSGFVADTVAAALSAHDADGAAHPDLRAALSAHDADPAAHPDLRAGLSGLEDRVTALEDSGFVTLDDQGKIPVSLLPGMGFIEMIDGDIPAEQRMENTIYASRKWDVSVPAESE